MLSFKRAFSIFKHLNYFRKKLFYFIFYPAYNDKSNILVPIMVIVYSVIYSANKENCTEYRHIYSTLGDNFNVPIYRSHNIPYLFQIMLVIYKILNNSPNP